MENREIKRYLVLYNIAKRKNVKCLMTLAAAHKFTVVIVGMAVTYENINHNNLRQTYGDVIVDSVDDCLAFLVANNCFQINGIEIANTSVRLSDAVFHIDEPIAFIPGNEGTGLNSKAMSICSDFVYIPQFGSGTASLNVFVAVSIVLDVYSRQTMI